MCGICGFTGATENTENERTLEAMCAVMAHRGPDGEGRYLDDGIALGHRRLSLIDLEGGFQPMVRATGERAARVTSPARDANGSPRESEEGMAAKGDFAIVFNGEIYNYRELRAELSADGWAFETNSDTEVLLTGYLAWGEGVLDRLRGMFAVAIWNRAERELFCARDPFGIKPFYYTIAHGARGPQVVFASEIKCILEHPAYNRELNARLYSFIAILDGQAQTAFQYREQKIAEARMRSFRLIAGLVVAAIALLVASHLIIIRDLHRRERDRKSLEEALSQNRNLSDMRKKIIVTLSHDIRGPLNAISGSAELALDTRDRKRRNAYLGNIIDSSRHIARLANSLLDLSRLNEAKETLNNVPFHLGPFLECIAEEYTKTANDKGLLFIKDIKNANVTVSGDADRVEQVIGNLLDNAVKFTNAGAVRFLASYTDGRLEVSIEDTGIGMDEETAGRIFRPFERAAPEMDADGFGLGLSITRGLVALLEGEISVSSRIGEGSVFKVSVPLPESTEQAGQETCPVSGSLRLPRRVLVVDDSPVQLRIVGEMLERSGVSCRTCVNAREVVSAMRLERYDLILADIQMRGTHGFDLLRLLRHSNIGDSRTIPVAAMTARSDGDGNGYAEAGFSGCIRKPFSTHELLHFISSVISAKPEQEERNADFDALFPETADRDRMLEAFIEESNHNKADLQEALQHIDMDIERMKETLHRMYPTWEQLGVACELETYSRILHDDTSDDLTISTYTETVIGRIDRLVGDAKNLLSEIRKLDLKNYTDETQNTHS